MISMKWGMINIEKFYVPSAIPRRQRSYNVFCGKIDLGIVPIYVDIWILFLEFRFCVWLHVCIQMCVQSSA